ncbi:transcription initiation factor TFIID subunit 6 isoform X2 [Juglans microcarpa x Juglans regia]|uniref:transcription initiation factor TFIID subunit 6 isoform X2 n=1 Tax=Juglans microcarpa x Juglans regia TaxID=2249226 RepID=UPI001B7EA1A2|nr:transcription initiation factor TFIID subunit 6 isoform X2 [Juglans microcarpa x Juglans regia]
MSIVPKENIEVIAQSIGINNLSSDVALALAPDAEYRMREIMQEAIKCMRHSKRTTLTADDVDAALNMRNVEPIYGFASMGPLRFKRAIGQRDLFYIDDKDVDLKDVIETPLPKAPLDTAVHCHWLAIEGVQPAIPENASVEAPSDGKKLEQKEQKDDGLPVDIKLPVKHVLSRELQLYFDKITELTMNSSDSVLFKQALVSLATDSGLHPLVPYFTYFIADEVSRGLSDYSLLFALMRIVRSLLRNPHIHIEPYLHQLMPSVVTCLVARRLGNRFADNHWELRDFTANLVASICKRFGHVYSNLQTRLTKTLLNAFLDPKRAMTQQYGAIRGLAALGPTVVRILILPNLEPYMRLLEPEMLLEKQKNEMKRHEAWRVYGTLLHAAGQCLYDRLKVFPPLSSQPASAVWRTNARVIGTALNKRKRSMEQVEEQSPHKKIATDGPILADLSNSSPPHMEGKAVLPDSTVDSNVGPSSSSRQMFDEIMLDGRGRRDEGDNQALNASAMLTQIWKNDLDSGRLLDFLFDQFGEGILSFIPAPEMSLFL